MKSFVIFILLALISFGNFTEAATHVQEIQNSYLESSGCDCHDCPESKEKSAEKSCKQCNHTHVCSILLPHHFLVTKINVAPKMTQITFYHLTLDQNHFSLLLYRPPIYS
jgi:hypothetical protein